jgi:hypothetical protein
MRKSRILHVFNPCVSRQVVNAAIRASGLMTRNTRRHRLTTSSQAHEETSLDLSRHVIDSVRKTTTHLFVSIDRITREAGLILLAAYAPRRSRLFCLYGKGSWTRILVIAAIASIRTCVTRLHEGIVNGSGVLDLIFALDFPFTTCSIKDTIAFRKFSIE